MKRSGHLAVDELKWMARASYLEEPPQWILERYRSAMIQPRTEVIFNVDPSFTFDELGHPIPPKP